VPVLNIIEARAALRAGRPEELLGVAECGWLDVKGGIYRLDDLANAEELAKDVAAFANTKTGGLILIGFSTRKEHDAEVIDQVRPVPRELVDLDQYRKSIRGRVIPAPRELIVEWIDCGEGKGILQVDVPAQPLATLPHVVSGAVQAPGKGRITVALPVREGDATAWRSQAEIQRLLSVGWAKADGPSAEFLAQDASLRKLLRAVGTEVADCPPLFTVTRPHRRRIKVLQFYRHQYLLTLWCQHPGYEHPWPPATYSINEPRHRLASTSFRFQGRLTSAKGADLRALRAIVFKHDPARLFGGLQRVLTPSGDFLWVCPHHHPDYEPGLPDLLLLAKWHGLS
jgi:hypothetical protein